MIYYQINIRVKKDISNQWLEWMKKTHIPEVLDTGYFISYKISKVIKPVSEDDIVEFSIVYKCESFERYLDYSVKAASDLQNKHTEMFNGKVKAYRKVMVEV